MIKINSKIIIMSDLGLTSNYKDKNRIEMRVPETCELVLKFLSWLQEVTSKLIWISADPGCGKSVLSRSLIDGRLLTSDARMASTYYFFFKDDARTRNSWSTASHHVRRAMGQLQQNLRLVKSFAFLTL